MKSIIWLGNNASRIRFATLLFLSIQFAQAHQVRVLLKAISDDIPVTIQTSSSDAQVISADGKKICKAQEIVMRQKKGQLFVNGKRTKQSVIQIKPIDGYISYAQKQYEGYLECLMHQKELMIINVVPLEPYISSVLRTESWPGWPLEVNKAFAIASRSYVLAMMEQAKKSARPFHVHNCNKHQTYQGVHDKQILKDAVAQTEGVILTYNNAPIVAMFDACCGGVIPAHIDDTVFVDAPYLARSYACTYCKPCWIYNWKATLTAAQLQEQLKIPVPISHMCITKRDKAGLVQQLQMQQGKKNTMVDGKSIYKGIKEIKSFHYSIKEEGDLFHLEGRGYGHHIGLCQWGAREMVRDGWDYRRILKFYYPKTVFARCA